MPRISQQFKDFINLVAAAAIGIASGFWVDAVSKHETYTLWVVLIGVCLAIQVALVFVSSQDMAELEEYRKTGRLDLQTKNAMAAQELKAVEEGRLDDALTWRKALDTRKERKP